MNQVATQDKSALMEGVLIGGDLSKLSSDQRLSYYMKVCESVGLNHLTRPLEYITLNNKLVLYAKRDATDQLRTVHNISVEEMTETEREGVIIVTAKVRNAAGRTDVSKGAVNIANLKGDALANAIMKAETKAKRRATLSICGLGLLDETELETIPAAAIQQEKSSKSVFKNASLRHQYCENVTKAFDEARDMAELKQCVELYADKFKEMEDNGNEHDLVMLEDMRNIYNRCANRLKKIPREDSEEAIRALQGYDHLEELLDEEEVEAQVVPHFLKKTSTEKAV